MGLKSVRFSKVQLAFFVIAGATFGYVLFRTFAAPNPNLPGDLDNNGIVDIFDMSTLLSNFGTNSTAVDIDLNGNIDIFDLSTLLSRYTTTDPACDFSQSGTVDVFDLSILLSHYGG